MAEYFAERTCDVCGTRVAVKKVCSSRRITTTRGFASTEEMSELSCAKNAMWTWCWNYAKSLRKRTMLTITIKANAPCNKRR